jgi:hypothetical protein
MAPAWVGKIAMGKGYGAELTRSFAPEFKLHLCVQEEVPADIKLRLERLAFIELVYAMADAQSQAGDQPAEK